jgi:hypothetical protein
MLPQPPMLGFKAKDTALMHDDEKHNPPLMVIPTGVSSASGGGVLLPKMLKEVKE